VFCHALQFEMQMHNASKVRVLDVSGGTGFASVQLARMGYEVVLLDGSEETLGIARQQAKGASEAGLEMRPEFAAIARYIQVIPRVPARPPAR
jgi:2-polyprenyl-3-methyl-5-hydroxy-6-metoxy-1,4-benzoquinol methylase